MNFFLALMTHNSYSESTPLVRGCAAVIVLAAVAFLIYWGTEDDE